MRHILFKFCILTSTFAILHVQILACSVTISPLRKDFRWADTIFVGEVTDILDKPDGIYGTERYPVFGIVKFRVEKSWKGSNEDELTIPSDVAGGRYCPDDFDSFKKGEKYLVFAKRNYVPFGMSTKLQFAEDKLRRLDSFWFRTWARVYPY
jgi:hypothetical protein